MILSEKLSYLLKYAFEDKKATGRQMPALDGYSESGQIVLISRYMATCGRYPDDDPNLDSQKRNLAIRTFIDHDIDKIRAHGIAWLERFAAEHGHAPWYSEWYRILRESSDEEIARIYLSSDEESDRLRISRPTGLLTEGVALEVKRSGVPK